MTERGLSVLIPHKSGPLSTKALAMAITMFRENTSGGDYELIIVDGFKDPYVFWNAYSEHARYEILVFFNDDMLPAPGWDIPIRKHADDNSIVTGYLVEPGVVSVAFQNIRRDFGRSPAEFRRNEFEDFCSKQAVPEMVAEEGWHMPVAYTKSFFRKMGKYPTEKPFPHHNDVHFRDRCKDAKARLVRVKSFAYHFQGMSNPENDARRPAVPILNIVTAVSRPDNLNRVFTSIDETVQASGLDVRWLLIFDLPNDAPAAFQARADASSKFKVRKLFWKSGPSKFGILQKNMGIDHCEAGYYFLLDDDNVVHPDFFRRLGQIIRSRPDKQAFAFGQRRWDWVGDLPARPDQMIPGRIDNSMFVVHTDVIGNDRYDLGHAGDEDGHFFRGLFQKRKDSFLFVDEFLSYYNFLKHFPKG